MSLCSWSIDSGKQASRVVASGENVRSRVLIVAVPVSGDLKIGETKIAEIEMTVVETIPDTLTGEMMIGETTSGLVEKTR